MPTTSSTDKSPRQRGMLALSRRLFLDSIESRWQLFLLTGAPVLLMTLLYLIFNVGIVRDLDIAVVDLDHSHSSRLLTRYLEASPRLRVSSFNNAEEARRQVRLGRYSALITLPYGLQSKLANSRQPSIDIRYNGQYLLLGKQANSAIKLALSAGLKKLSTKVSLLKGLNRQQSQFMLSPIQQQLTPLNNPNSNYLAFLLPAITIALWQVISVLSISNSCSRLLLQPALFQQHSTAKLWIAQLLAATLPLWLLGVSALALLYGIIALPLAGSLALLALGLAMMLLALFSVIALIAIIVKDNVRAISVCAALFAPAFAFMGVTFPSSDMPVAAQLWREVMPSTHFMQLLLDQLSRAANMSDLWNLLHLSLFSLLLLPLALFSRHYRSNSSRYQHTGTNGGATR
ncbi:ABC-2 type transport system permease protein [Sinobacterium caligoides]|uniref:ABC-2 type transport system permease protein n=2 Tax=Sinobacterium caligoides TaxID=933926 RepID=A0A3N2DZS0_9GAMM|nr:ABC-2 type transport system permease protein [Sinobacterium caligoides]